MTENVCKNCGAPLEVAAAVSGVIACSFCGSVFTLPKSGQTDEVKRLIDAGKTALDQCRFDDAFASFTKAIEADGGEPEAYWGRALARNKVQYLRDTVNNRLQPICHEVSDEAFTSDPDYNKALSLATPEQKAEYAKKAEEIDYIRREFAALTKSGLTYDSFICVKVTEDGGGHTEDSFAALKLYNALKKAGYKPFFSEEEMGERTGADYEALILYALYTAPSLLIVCSDKKYLETKWVKNEYTRFAAMLADEEKERDSMTIVYRGKPIEKLPGVKGKIQGVDFAGFDAIERIKRFIDRHDAGKRAAEQAAAAAAQAREAAAKAAEAKAAAERKAREEAARAAEAAEEKARAERLRAERERAERAEAARQKALRRTPRYERSDLPREARLKADAWFAISWLAFIAAFVSSVAGVFIGTVEALPLRPVWFPVWIAIEALGGIAIVVYLIAQHKADGGFFRRVPAWLIAGQLALYAAVVTLTALNWVKPSDGMRAAYLTMSVGFWVVTVALLIFYIVRGWKKGGYVSTFLTAAALIPLAFVSLSVGSVAAMSASGYWAGYDGYAEGYYYTEKADGTVAVAAVEYDGAEATIPAELSGRKVTEVLAPFRLTGRGDVRTLVIPEGVTSIGEYAFSSFGNLRSVTLPSTLETVGYGAFRSCAALTEIELPEGLTTIEGWAFAFCGNLQSVALPSTLQSVGTYAFIDCAALERVVIPDNVAVGGYAFSGCTGLTMFRTGVGASVGEHAFYGCMALREAVLGGNIGAYAFDGCTALETLNIERTVTSIGEHAFGDCTSLTEAVIPDTVTEMGSMVFSGCTNLTVYCEAADKPEDWHVLWDYGGVKVDWGAAAGTETTRTV